MRKFFEELRYALFGPRLRIVEPKAEYTRPPGPSDLCQNCGSSSTSPASIIEGLRSTIAEKDAEIARLKAEIERINTQANELDVLFQDRVSQCIALRTERDALSQEKNLLASEIERKDVALRRAREDMDGWAAYAGEWRMENYGLANDLAAIDAALTNKESSNG